MIEIKPGEYALFFDCGHTEIRKVRSVTPHTVVVDALAHESTRRQSEGLRRHRHTIVGAFPDIDAAKAVSEKLRAAWGEKRRRQQTVADWYAKRRAEILADGA